MLKWVSLVAAGRSFWNSQPYCTETPGFDQTQRAPVLLPRPIGTPLHTYPFLPFFWNDGLKLQALVYDILPSTTAVFSYAIGPRKLSANEQFFVGAQTVVRLLQTTQIKQGVSFIAANKVYTTIV